MIYKPEFAEEARTMCRLGATDEELAEHFDVRVRTIYRWRNAHEEFAEAVIVGKEFADDRVERALYSRAVGCSVQRTKVFRTAADPDPVYATYMDHLPPDTQAALHWLRVRQPKKWAVRRERDDVDEAAWEDALEHRLDRAARRNEEIERSGQHQTPPAPPPASPPPRPEAAAPPPAQRPEDGPASAPSRAEDSSASGQTPPPRAAPAAEEARPGSGAAPPPHASAPPPPARPLPAAAPPSPVPAPAPAPRPLFELFPRPGGGYGQPPPPAGG